jgi:nucleolar protein 53
MEKTSKATTNKPNGIKRKVIDIGAPSQKYQPTRKGKKAWRKNVDIADIEQGIEGLREEERVTG